MKIKYFIVSDIHSFYTPLRDALKRKKFDLKNPKHVLVVAGDIFDRGDETMKLFKFLKLIPEGRLILIRGNHEYLYEELLNKYRPDQHDISNGTVKTFCQIAGVNKKTIKLTEWREIIEKVRNSEVTQFIRGIKTYYFEVGDYIITHSCLPVNYANNTAIYSWYRAIWNNPYLADEIPGKTVIFGHWRTSEGPLYTEGKLKGNIFYGKGKIGIDAGVKIDSKTGKLTHEQVVFTITK